ncbi:MAG TPA: HEAT repeat domain-containing protein [Vicinamibacterales bacterium]|nr:HEAT repeat domain-containing protein [Vicinamibacterales bacterium]
MSLTRQSSAWRFDVTELMNLFTPPHVRTSLVAISVLAAGCAAAPPVVTAPPKTVAIEQKMAWLLQLEDRRILRLDPPPAPPVVETPVKGRGRAATPPPPPAAPPDLTVLVTDTEARIRRRAALAIGRVGLVAGVQPLVTTLSDADQDVREMAAFALGLIGDASATPPLMKALSDSSPIVRGRAAEALGQINAKDKPQVDAAARRDAGDAIGRMVAEYARTSAVSMLQGDDETWPAAPEAEAFRLGTFALVRLGTYEPLAAAVLDSAGSRVTTWWPVAYAVGRIEDKRAAPALMKMLNGPGKYSPAFAARGLGVLKETSSVTALIGLVQATSTPTEVVVSAVRALATIGDSRGVPAIVKLASDATDPNVRLEAVTALGTLKAAEGLSVVQDYLTDSWPTMRARALRAAASIDVEDFLLVLSGMEPDRDWTVRAALADVLATMGPQAVERTRTMLRDEDRRVVPSVLNALARLKAPDAGAIAIAQLKEPDYVVRSTAARVVGELKPPGGVEALREAWTLAGGDAAIDARAAILSALAEYGGDAARAMLKEAVSDKDWAVRVHVSTLLAKLDPSGDYQTAIRPAPGQPPSAYESAELIGPAYSPHVFIETAKGTIEIELAVLDAPQTSWSFMALVRKGFFNGLQIHRVVPNFVVQDGDPRGDGEGGPGYTIRDELNERPYLRGTVGMALSWKDTGGSQFFITHSPQPHLDARYTAFGKVVNGMDVVDRIQQGDTIKSVKVWDGKTMSVVR